MFTVLPDQNKSLRNATAVFLLPILALFGVMAGERATVWKDSLTLWSDAVRKYPGNDTAKYNLADVYLESGQLDKAKPLLEQLLASKPKNATFHELLGHYYYKTGDLREQRRIKSEKNSKKSQGNLKQINQKTNNFFEKVFFQTVFLFFFFS